MHDVLSGLQRQIMIVDELIHNDVSSTKVRYPQYPLGLLSPFMLSLDMEERYERLGNRGYNWLNCVHDRRNITRGLSVKYLIADSVINYIKTHQLYTTNPVAHQAWQAHCFWAIQSSLNAEQLFVQSMSFACIYCMFSRNTCVRTSSSRPWTQIVF